MSDRIRQLEVALAIEYATTSKDTHPLLTPELMSIKSSLELHAAQGGVNGSEQLSEAKDQDEESQYIDAFGTLALHDDGAATFYGRSAGSEASLLSFAMFVELTESLSYVESAYRECHLWLTEQCLLTVTFSANTKLKGQRLPPPHSTRSGALSYHIPSGSLRLPFHYPQLDSTACHLMFLRRHSFRAGRKHPTFVNYISSKV